jgi:hypothetical protein
MVSPCFPSLICYASRMTLLVRAVVTGFGLALGSALFKEARNRLGWTDEEDEVKAAKRQEKVNAQDGATDPNLQTT